MDIVERLQIADISYHPLNFDAVKEIKSLRTRLAEAESRLVEVEKERDELGNSLMTSDYALKDVEEQLAAVTKDAVDLSCVKDLAEIVRMPNAEYIADAHNTAVRKLRAAMKEQTT